MERDKTPPSRFQDLKDQSATVQLRNVEDRDLPQLFDFQLDPESNQLAATHPRTEDDFHAHWRTVLADPAVIVKAVLIDGTLAGSITVFPSDGHHWVGYWIGREFWGRGVATMALQQLLGEIRIPNLRARVAADNGASLKVLQKCGFRMIDREYSPATDRFVACEEIVLEVTRTNSGE